MDRRVCKISQHSPCLLNESDDKFAHLNRLISLKCNDFLNAWIKAESVNVIPVSAHVLTQVVEDGTVLTSRKLSSNEGSLLIINSCT